jgi:hypothetical protein
MNWTDLLTEKCFRLRILEDFQFLPLNSSTKREGDTNTDQHSGRVWGCEMDWIGLEAVREESYNIEDSHLNFVFGSFRIIFKEQFKDLKNFNAYFLSLW